MILKLDPRWPLVWRDPMTLQIGVDPARAVLEGLDPLEEMLVSALAVGAPRHALDVLADGRGAVVDALLDRLRGVLLDGTAPPPAHRIAISGADPLAGTVARMLRSLGHDVTVAAASGALADTSPDLAIAVGRWVLEPRLHSFWLRRDAVHLPVVVTDAAVHIGPIVEPGDGPCLLCLELHHRDRDAAWPAIASQLLGRAGGAEHPALIADAAAVVVRLVLSRLDAGPVAARSVRIGVDGDREDRLWSPHPECGCRGIAHLVPVATGPRENGSATAPSAPVLPLPTRATDGGAPE